MSTSPANTTPPARSHPTECAAPRALAFWRAQVRAAADEGVLTHARQALLLAARQGAPAADLASLAVALHEPLMQHGQMRTWAHDLQRLFAARPDVPAAHPALWEQALSAWTAAGEWGQAQRLLQSWPAAAGPRPWAIARRLYRQGALLWMQGRWTAALRLAQQAWRLARTAPNEQRVAIASLLVLATWRLGRRKHARRWGRRGLALCPPDAGLWRGRLHHYLFLVSWPTAPHRAQQHLRMAQEQLRAAGGYLQLAHLLADSTDLYLTLGRRDQAEEALAQAYALWRQSEDPAGLADYYRHAAIVSHALGQRALARDYAAHAAERWAALGVTREVRRCQRLLQRWRTAA